MSRSSAVLVVLLVVSLASAAEPPQEELTFTKWTPDVNVPDPVAISFDNQGRAYVTQTQRRKAQDLDIRAHRNWTANDVSLQSVDDKRAFYHRILAAGGSGPVDDHNQDGAKDYHDLMVISEKIHRLSDTNNDGLADQLEEFAEDFRTEVTGIAAGVLWHDGDVFATIAPDVWRLRDTNGDGRADQRQAIAHGFGVHIAYAGHDMHGLTIGPDGKLYWSIGDKGISVTAADGRRFLYPNQGGVMRCNLDGSDFEVFAHGLRNVQELAFDTFGNLFGVDNDADQPGEKERFVYIVRDMDAGWRCNYQYRGSDYNPWTDERLWHTHFPHQAAYITPPLSHSINGPAGFVFNPGTALSPRYKDYFFLTGAPNGEQIAFQVEANGASFRMIHQHAIGRGIPLVGINFGPDGALYGVDWGGGYPLNQKGAVWKIDDPQHANHDERQAVQAMLAAGFGGESSPSLQRRLAHPDQRIRLGAQFELARRGELDALIQTLMGEAKRIEKVHAVWGIGQLARAGSAESMKRAKAALIRTTESADAELRAQAAKAYADLPGVDGSPMLPLLKDDDPRVVFHAALALRHCPIDAVAPIAAMIQRHPPTDVYLRHAGAMALAGQPNLGDVVSLADHASGQVRLAAVIALRQRRHPGVARFLDDPDAHIQVEAARAIHDDFSIEEALPALAECLTPKRLASLRSESMLHEAFVRRVIGANHRIGSQAAAQRLAQFAAQEEASQAMRLEALETLAAWSEPFKAGDDGLLPRGALDRVTGRHRPRHAQRQWPSSLNQWLKQIIVGDEPKLVARAMAAVRALRLDFPEDTLATFVHEATDEDVRIEALNALGDRGSQRLKASLDVALAAESAPQLQLRALEMLVEQKSPGVLERLTRAYAAAKSSPQRQAMVSLIGRVVSPDADTILTDLFEDIGSEPSHPEMLEFLEIFRSREQPGDDVKSALARHQQARPREDDKPEWEFRECLEGGDRVRGKSLFETHLQAQCARCHRVGDKGSTVGPNLAGVGSRRDERYLLRSIVAPSADIDAKYRSHVYRLDSGKVIQGLLLRENDETIVIANAQGKEVRIDVDAVEASKVQDASIMPEVVKTLSRREIRDLVAYLESLKASPKSREAKNRNTK